VRIPAATLLLIVSSLTLAAADDKPKITHGVQIGLLDNGQAVIWSRCDRPAKMNVAYAGNRRFKQAKIATGGVASPANDYTARQILDDLPAGGKTIWLKVWFTDAANPGLKSEPAFGHFHHIGKNDSLHFVWGGDTAGQGFGINPQYGGFKIYTTMRKLKPRFFIQSGDNIYADSPIEAQKRVENGSIWINRVSVPELGKVAQTLDEFRARYKYNLEDTNLLRFNSETPQIWQWDDHEVVNNWSPSKKLNENYTEVKDLQSLLDPAAKAFHEYAPLPLPDSGPYPSIYRTIGVNGLLDIFVLDMRSFRGPNSANLQTTAGPETAFLGAEQVEWLERALQNSTAAWKIIAADQPLGLCIPDEGDKWEGVANCDNGKPAGRELEIAELLRFIKQRHITGIVWLAAEVHYTAAHYYDPAKSAGVDFLPFWEFIAGPLNAGTFGPSRADRTFGLEVDYCKTRGHYLKVPGWRTREFCANPPPDPMAKERPLLSPAAGYQFFGEVAINRNNRLLTVNLRDSKGSILYSRTLRPD
jgi:alkaline phosphatase D